MCRHKGLEQEKAFSVSTFEVKECKRCQDWVVVGRGVTHETP